MKGYDLIIAGAGPAGLTAGVYAARAKLEVVLYEKMLPGGQAATTDLVENYPGFPKGISGSELMAQMAEQAEKFGLNVESKSVENISRQGDLCLVKTEDGEEHPSKTVIVATGAEPKSLGVPGEAEFKGRGVSYCATCDGPLYQGKKVAVVGGGDSAVEEALFLTRFAEKVYLIHRRDKLRATQLLQNRTFENKKIEFVWDSVVTEIGGGKSLESVVTEDVKTEKISELGIDGLFVYIGTIPNSDLFEEDIKRDKRGFVITDQDMATSIEGVFAAGDVRSKLLYQIATAVGDGATAAFAAEKFIEQG
jgi:thioredoxin reductase (NADPH)